MTAEAEYAAGVPPRLVGQVFTEMVIRNGIDASLAREGLRDAGEVRQVTIRSVFVDTGATHICLPGSLIAELGLPLRREIVVSTAGGERRARLVGPAEVEISGRVTFVEIIELPGGEQPLLGVVPMESLGLEPDLRNQRLRLLPETGPETHFTAY